MVKRILKISKYLIFICLLILVMQRVSWAVMCVGTAEDSTDRRSCLFYSLPQNTVDVALAGSSHMYCTLSPQLIYDQTGITAASFATSSQSVENTYWMLKEALNRQSIKVFVMDIGPMMAGAEVGLNNTRLHYTSGISIMPDFSINKIRNYLTIKEDNLGWSEDMTIHDAWGILEYRNDTGRWHFKLADLLETLIDPASKFYTFGFMAGSRLISVDELKKPEPAGYVDLTTTYDYQYLCKIRDLCEEKGVELVMIQSPFVWEKDNGALFQQTEQWAEENNIPVINYFDLLEEVGIDTQTDMLDEDHLNYLGAKKATAYFTKFLQENYDLTDHRGDSKYELWERHAFSYAAVEEKLQVYVDRLNAINEAKERLAKANQE